MEELIEYLFDGNCRGVVKGCDGVMYHFMRKGVVDLYELLISNPLSLKSAMIADRVIGRGAALLMVAGGVTRVHGIVMSSDAIRILRDASIEVTFDNEVDYIINRTGTGRCPVELATIDITNPSDAKLIIGEFLKKHSIIKS